MSYTPSSTSQPYQQQPKDNRKVIYGVLVAALLLTWGYIIYDKSQSKELVAAKDMQIVSATSAKDSIQQDFNLASAKLDSMAGTNVKLQGALAEKNEDIIKLKQNISSILRNKNATASELKQARAMISELNGKIDNLFADLEKAKAENQQLTVANTQLSTDKQQLAVEKQAIAENLAATDAAKKSVEDVASTLHASNLSIAAINVKNSGREKETTTAKRADLLRFAFDLDENRIAPSGNKEIYITVTAPDGNTITKGSTFTTRDAGEKTYTEKVDVMYEQGKRKPVSFDWKQDGASYQTGDYKIQIYHNGFKIGEGTKTLKKGGLFS